MKKGGKVSRLAVVLAGIQIITLLIFAGRKKGYFIDEIYSWGLANGYYKPFVASYDVFDQWITGEEFTDYITVQEGERFAYGSVYYNQTQDVHPPLFYMAMHTICSFTPGVQAMWQGMALNVLFYGGCLWLIFLTARALTESEKAAMAAMAVWGFSPGGLSTGLYIRMYMMMTFFTMATVYLHVRMAKEGQSFKRLSLICLATFLGLMTQYYFVFIAFFLSAVYVLWKLWRRRWKEAAVYAAALFGSVGLMAAAYPACIAQLTRTDEFVANETRNNFMNGAVIARNLVSYISDINLDFFGVSIRDTAVAAVLLLAGMWLWRKGSRQKDKGRPELTCSDRLGLALGIVWLLAFLSVSMAAVVTGVRYIYNLYPLFSILAVWAVQKATSWGLKGTRALGPARWGILVVMGILFLGGFGSGCVRYLFPENEERVRFAQEHRALYCLYLDEYENAPLTQDLMELARFQGVYVMPESEIEHVQDILSQKDVKDDLVVYVDTSQFWSSGYDGREVMEKLKRHTGAEAYEYLYGNVLSETYLLKGVK